MFCKYKLKIRFSDANMNFDVDKYFCCSNCSCIDIFEFYIEFMSSINCDDEQESCWARDYTAKEGLVRIQYKCLVSSYVFQEIKLFFPKLNYNVLSPSSYTYICERFIHFQDRSAYSAAGKYVDRAWKIDNRHMNVEIETEAAQLPEKECISGIFVAVCSGALTSPQGLLTSFWSSRDQRE